MTPASVLTVKCNMHLPPPGHMMVTHEQRQLRSSPLDAVAADLLCLV